MEKKIAKRQSPDFISTPSSPVKPKGEETHLQESILVSETAEE